MKVIENQNFDEERALYGSKGVIAKHCNFDGPADGESAFKECTDIMPFCYCKNLKLVDCEMTGTDLCFEKSEVDAVITTPVISIKNPLSGTIIVPAVDELIMDDEKAKGNVIIQKEVNTVCA